MEKKEIYIDLISLYLGSIHERLLKKRHPLRFYVTTLDINIASFLYELFKQRPAIYTGHENYDSLIQLAFRLGIDEPKKFVDTLIAELAWEIIGVRSQYIKPTAQVLSSFSQELFKMGGMVFRREATQLKTAEAAKKIEKKYAEFYELFQAYRQDKSVGPQLRQKAEEIAEILEEEIIRPAFLTAVSNVKKWLLNKVREISINVTASQEGEQDEGEVREYTLKDIAREGYREWLDIESFYQRLEKHIEGAIEDFNRLIGNIISEIEEYNPTFTNSELQENDGNSAKLQKRLLTIKENLITPINIYRYLIGKIYYLFETAARVNYIFRTELGYDFHEVFQKVIPPEEEGEHSGKESKKPKFKENLVDEYFDREYYENIAETVKNILLDANQVTELSEKLRAVEAAFLLKNYHIAISRVRTGQNLNLPINLDWDIEISPKLKKFLTDISQRWSHGSSLRIEIHRMIFDTVNIYKESGVEIDLDPVHETVKVANSVAALWLWYAVKFLITQNIEGKKIRSVGVIGAAPNRVVNFKTILYLVSQYERSKANLAE